MTRKEDDGKDYFQQFKDSHWAARGSDPEAEEKVLKEFTAKFEKVREVSRDPGFLDNLRLLWNYL
ncbi:MAG: hypothetical protein MUC63_05125, partial [Planctomycetes bacterium]|nr:hypothetical protein [Planctomycetota bacterium]